MKHFVAQSVRISLSFPDSMNLSYFEAILILDTYSVTVEERPVFTHLEVADDLSFVVCADATSNIYLVNLDEYFEESPSQLIVPVCSRVRGSSVGSVKFRYELNDEDSVARDLEMSGVAYGDRVWKTELLAFRRDAKQACLGNVSGECDM